jgi:O-antigen ligase
LIQAQQWSAARRLTVRAASAGGVALATLLVGLVIGSGGIQARILVLGIVPVVTILFRPIIGLYACYFLLLIVPYTDQRLDIPVFHSPLQMVAMVAVAGALLQHVASRRSLPKSRLYLPLALVIALYIMFAAVQHGDVPAVRAYDFLAGTWPLVLILLLVDTPRRARNVLFGMLSATVILTVLWLPGLISLSTAGLDARYVVEPGATAGTPAVSLLGAVGSLSVQTLVALALVAPVLLGIGLSTPRWRVPSLLGFIVLGVTIFAATYASAVATLIVGTITTVGLFLLPMGRARPARVRGALIVIPVIILLAAIGLSLKPGQDALYRLTNPRNDISGSSRITSLEEGWHAFLEEPLIGQGAYNTYYVTAGGWVLGGHNTFGVMAYEYGLLLLLPFLWMLWAMGRELTCLLREAVTPVERGLGVGFLASLVAAIVTGFLTPTFAQVFQDTILWTLVGLAIVWNNWKAADAEATLVA